MSETVNKNFDPELRLDEILAVWEDKEYGGEWRDGDLMNFLGARGLNNERFSLSEDEKLQITQAIIKRKPKDALSHRQMLKKWLTKPMAVERDTHIKYIREMPHYKPFFEDENFGDELSLSELANRFELFS